MKKRIFPFTTLAMAMIASGKNVYFDIPRHMNEQQKRRHEEYLKQRNHRLNPIDMSEREFIICGERIMAHDKKTAIKIYANHHPEIKKRKK